MYLQYIGIVVVGLLISQSSVFHLKFDFHYKHRLTIIPNWNSGGTGRPYRSWKHCSELSISMARFVDNNCKFRSTQILWRLFDFVSLCSNSCNLPLKCSNHKSGFWIHSLFEPDTITAYNQLCDPSTIQYESQRK